MVLASRHTKILFEKLILVITLGLEPWRFVSRQTTLFGTVEERKLPSVYIGLAVTVL